MDDRDRKELVRQAFLAQQQAYAPYSEFLVGAALLTEDGKDLSGCNLRMRHISPGNLCGAGTAFFKAVSEGRRILRRSRSSEINGAKPEIIVRRAACAVR